MTEHGTPAQDHHQDTLRALAAEQDRQNQELIEALQRELGLTA